MIAIDSSAIVAILLAEIEAKIFWHIIAQEEVLIGAPTLCETHMVLESRLRSHAGQAIEDFIADGAIRIAAFDRVMSQAAIDAFRLYGKGRGHPAKLNLGDCLSYAVAKVHAVPLLFKGNDFIHTDLVPAYNPAS
ncbi:type II toxin-antitoxin system VapC family toxin [Methylobacterium sp. J-048]|uniref:type II toxin-antitoxin system VapC family toxin n=1 Tax=Methylobacterium sp. J-048 TaxID=2836635 RepID=UPI001FB9F530|nr:type II toxin-antitoxin system VapC family toxin [Methylobacterium sp. J-048]MCJ2060686.1 type II toxin-antitoxin system VapC family toxin [Methylobacterium sp. J-048]